MRIGGPPLIGLLAGIAAPAVYLVPEILDRAQWALSGGRGERSYWGEPLFYLMVASLPCGLAGLIAGWAVAKVRERHGH